MPRPKARPVVARGRAFTPARTAAHEAAIAMYARKHVRRTIFGPVAVDLYFVGAHASADVDNLAKAVLDGLQLGRAIDDDRQVVALTCERGRAGEPRTEITLRELGV